jgi:magnesium transporter
MNQPLDERLYTRLTELLHRPAEEAGNRLVPLTAALAGAHPADIADALQTLSHAEAIQVFRCLDRDRAAEVLDELDTDLVSYLLENAPRGEIADLLDRLPMDDAAEVVADASPEQAEALMADLTARAPADAAEVRELLSYPPRTAGRLMTDKFIRLSAAMSAAEAFSVVRAADADVETVNELYVVERRGAGGEPDDHLIGVLSLRDLITAPPERLIGAIMVPEPMTATVDTDQEEVARIMSRYDFRALPVLDRDNHLAGIITIDDVIDVLVEEFNEDYMRLVGSDAEEMDRRTPAQVARLRLPWLMGTMGIELCAALVIAHYDPLLKQVSLLTSFMPVISAISGNVGLQAAAIVVRGLDTGHVRLSAWGASIARELQTCLVLALVCGLVLGAVGAGWSRHATFGMVIGVAMTCSILTAGLMGTLIPMLSKRLGFDPAATAGPFETAFQDVIGFAVFLWLASLLLHWLK